jgi:hypothetical protein
VAVLTLAWSFPDKASEHGALPGKTSSENYPEVFCSKLGLCSENHNFDYKIDKAKIE